MRYSMFGVAALLAIAGTSLVYAQPAPPPPGRPAMAGDPGPMADTPMPPPPPRGEQDGLGPRGRGPMPPPPSRAAHFRVEHGPNVVDVKCEDDQPLKACADIVERLVARLPAQPQR